MESDKLILKEVYFVTLYFSSANRQRKIEWYASFVGVMEQRECWIEIVGMFCLCSVLSGVFTNIPTPRPLKKAAANLQ